MSLSKAYIECTILRHKYRSTKQMIYMASKTDFYTKVESAEGDVASGGLVLSSFLDFPA